MNKEVRARQRALARAEVSLLASEALAEKARVAEERKRLKEQEKERKAREKEHQRLEKELQKAQERLAREEQERKKKEAARLKELENIARAGAYIEARRQAEAAATQQRATAATVAPPAVAQPTAAGTHRQPTQQQRQQARALPKSATTAGGLTSSGEHVIGLLNSAAVATLASFPSDERFATGLRPLLCTTQPRLNSEELLAFAASCSKILHEAWDTGNAYPRSKVDEACAAFAGMHLCIPSCTHPPAYMLMHCAAAKPHLLRAVYWS